MRAERLALWIAVGLACTAPGGRAAHEWRADWASPQSLEVLERLAHPAADAAAVELRACVPYGISGLTFQGVRLAKPAGTWQIHAGTLRCAQDYREWHLGVGATLRPGCGLRLLAGARVLGMDAALDEPVCWTGSLLLSATPTWLRALEVTGGLVDWAPGRAVEVTPIAVTRVRLTAARVRLVLDRSSQRGMDAETTILAWFALGPIGLLQGYRWAVGEASLAVTLRSGRCHVTVGERWHPELGGSPRLAVAWTPGEVP